MGESILRYTFCLMPLTESAQNLTLAFYYDLYGRLLRLLGFFGHFRAFFTTLATFLDIMAEN